MIATLFTSSTRDVPEVRAVPRHIAIIMDGNGRWAKQRMLPRVAGHRKGVEAVRATVRGCIEQGVEYLTLFAFSSENWRRPADEVSILMQLFLRALEQEVAKLDDNDIRFKVIGDTSRFEPKIRELIAAGEAADRRQRAPDADDRRQLRRALGHRAGGAEAAGRRAAARCAASRPKRWSRILSMAYAPEPDLFIRTGGEQRISISCCGSSPIPSSISPTCCGPISTPKRWARRSHSYRQRERRFGRTSEQLQAVRD